MINKTELALEEAIRAHESTFGDQHVDRLLLQTVEETAEVAHAALQLLKARRGEGWPSGPERVQWTRLFDEIVDLMICIAFLAQLREFSDESVYNFDAALEDRARTVQTICREIQARRRPVENP